MDLSVIIVSYKGLERLDRCLGSISRFKGGEFSFEVIVVDNNPLHEEMEEIEKQYPDFRFIHNKINGGFGYGNNIGSQSANGDYLLFLNPDTAPDERAVESLLNSGKSNPEYGIISCRQHDEKGRDSKVTGDFPSFCNITGFQRALLQLFRWKRKKIPGDVIFPDWVSGSVLLISKELFLRLKGFYEGYWMYFEDVDLCRKAAAAGYKSALLNDVFIEHCHGGSSRINLQTTSLTKTEVFISKHLYVSRNLHGFEKILTQVFLIINNLVTGFIMAIAGILLGFDPKLFVRATIYPELIRYYTGVVKARSWISPRSVLKPNIIVKKH